MSEHSLRLLDALRRRLHAAMRRQTAGEVAFGAVVLLGALAAVLLVGTGAEAAWHMGTGLRALWFWTFIAAGAALGLFFVGRPLARLMGWLPGLDERSVARRAGRVYPTVADRLTALLDLADGRTGARPGPLLDGAVQALGHEVEGVPFERIEDLRPARRAAPWASAPMLGLAAFLLVSPAAFTGAVGRLFAPTTAFLPPAPFSLRVSPGDAEIGRGEALVVTARAAGRAIPPDAVLEVRRDGEGATERVRLRRSGARFAHTLRDVDADLRYRLVAGPVTTPWYRVTVVPRPVVSGLQVVVVPPGRSGERARRLPPGVGDVTALAGAVVQVGVRVGGVPVERAALVFETEDGRVTGEIPMRLDGDRATAAFTLSRPSVYRVRLVAAGGLENAAPVRYRLGVLGDAPPTIALVDGARGALPDAARRLVVHIADDYGFRGLAVYWRRSVGTNRGPITRTVVPLQDPRALEQEVTFDGLLRALGRLAPGSTVELFGEVRDNDAAHGFKPARTPVFTLRVPTLPERFDRLGATLDSTTVRLSTARDEMREARQATRELREALRRDPQAGWEERRRMDALRESAARQDAAAQETRQNLRNALQEMQSGMASEQTTRMYEAMEEALRDLDSPELRDALQRLQEAMERLDFPQMMQALSEVEQSQTTMEERLERAMALLERLETAQQLDEAARRAEDLARREEELAEATERLDRQDGRRDGQAEEGEQGDEGRQGQEGREGEQGQQGEQGEQGEQSPQGNETPPGPQADPSAERERLEAEQRQAANDAEALQQQMRELQEQMEGQRGTPAGDMEQMADDMEQQDMPGQMERNADQLQQNQLGQAQSGQRRMAQQLRRMAQQMQSMSSQMSGQQQQADVAALRRALDDVITLSQEEERLAVETQRLPARSPALSARGRRQVELSGVLDTVTDTLRALSRAIPQLDAAVTARAGDARREMGGAVEQLGDGQAAPAAGHQRMAMTHLNDLALLLADALEDAQNNQQQSGGGGGGMPMPQMMQQMQQLGGQQQQLQQAIQQLLNQTAGTRMTEGQQGQAQRLAAQQDALRRQLEELAQEGEGRLDPRTQSALRRAAEAMDRTARELRAGRLTPETLALQTEILQRLLEAEDSVNQRDQDEQRESQRGRDLPNPGRPGTLPAMEGPAERLRRDLLRALDAGYSQDYEDLIRRYFERLR